MRLRERRREDDAGPGGEPSADGAPDGGGLQALRREGEEFLAAGDEAINRALSGDSQAFLTASRQQGGQ